MGLRSCLCDPGLTASRHFEMQRVPAALGPHQREHATRARAVRLRPAAASPAGAADLLGFVAPGPRPGVGCAGAWSIAARVVVPVQCGERFGGAARRCRLGRCVRPRGRRSRACRCSRGRRPSGSDSEAPDPLAAALQRDPSAVGGGSLGRCDDTLADFKGHAHSLAARASEHRRRRSAPQRPAADSTAQTWPTVLTVGRGTGNTRTPTPLAIGDQVGSERSAGRL